MRERCWRIFFSILLCHPFVIGELAYGNLHNRNEVLHLLEALPKLPLPNILKSCT